MLNSTSILNVLKITLLLLVIFSTEFFAGVNDSSRKNNEVAVTPGPGVILPSRATLLFSFHAPDGATRGLAFDGTYLWSANSGDGNSLYGPKIYKLDPNTGTVINLYTTPGNSPCGLAWDGQYLWHSDYGSGQIYKLDTLTVTPVSSFAAPGGFPFDLAYYDGYLYAVRGNTPFISKIDPATGTEVSQIQCTYTGAGRPFGLTAISQGQAGVLLAADDNSNTMNEYDFAAAAWITQWSSLPATYPTGLAYDPISGTLWVSCWSTDSIYVYSNFTGIASDPVRVSTDAQLFRNYPNPFNPVTTIEYEIPTGAKVTLRVLDVLGQEVTTLVNEYQAAGHYQTQWVAGNQPSGIYFYQIQAGNFRQMRKMILLK